MSFRSRLTLFFVLIVIVPMFSVAFVLFRLIADIENGKADARIAARQDAAINLTAEARRQADEAALRIGSDRRFATAIRDRDPQAQERELTRLRAEVRASRVVFTPAGSGPPVDVGARRAVFPATRELVGEEGRAVGRLDVAVQDAVGFARLAQRVTELEVVLGVAAEVLAATLDGSGRLTYRPGVRDVEIGSDEYRAATFLTRGFDGRQTRVTLLEPGDRTAADVRDSRVAAAVILAGFLVLALAFAGQVSRTLQRQIDGFLAAARRLGAGDFSSEVPTSGRDEFAELGEEFNKMSRQLEARLEDLRQERGRLETAMRRIGETFASNLDRDGLLEIVVGAAVDGVSADGGRATARRDKDAPLEQVAAHGAAPSDALATIQQAERNVLRSGQGADAASDGIYALAHPLRAGSGEGEGPPRVTGVVSAWRSGREFSESERDLFHYLTGQAEVSLENVGLHEVVERQAVTDELTGLSNRRRFQETMTVEAERSRRFGQAMGLVMLDIDNFKTVNDTYGHQQGDLVLREVARVLRDSSREIDTPARYGGEEMAVILPGTDIDGAYQVAERVRESIAALQLPLLGNGEGTLSVTASLGVAELPGSAGDVRELIAAADEALYEAKRSGKNRSVRAS